MLKSFPAVGRWEQTDDVFLLAAMRLRNALKDVTPRSTREFFGLAALQIRRELLNMTKTYRHRLTPSQAWGGRPRGRVIERGRARRMRSRTTKGLVNSKRGPTSTMPRRPFPMRFAKCFSLIWYHGLSQVQAAVVFGVSEQNDQGSLAGGPAGDPRGPRGSAPGDLKWSKPSS